MANTRPYYAPGSLSTAFYEVVTAADTRLSGDLEIYAGLAPAGGSVLELGAGSGRLTFGLAARGLSVVGVDLSPEMLDQARAAAPAGAAVELVLGDMTALDLDRTFDLVICPFFTLAHAPTGAPWARTFAVAARHLRPGGRFAVHLPLAEMMRLPGPADPDRAVMDEVLADGRRLQLFVRGRRFDEAAGRFDQDVDYVVRDASGAVVRRSLERMTFHVADPRPYAEAAGLVLDRPPIRHGGVGDIWVFRKR
jgi:SAM-dependent methyltransferase